MAERSAAETFDNDGFDRLIPIDGSDGVVRYPYASMLARRDSALEFRQTNVPRLPRSCWKCSKLITSGKKCQYVAVYGTAANFTIMRDGNKNIKRGWRCRLE